VFICVSRGYASFPLGVLGGFLSGRGNRWKIAQVEARYFAMSSSTTALPNPFGRYRILEKVGEGGMGTVYLAEDTRLGRRVALKVPHFSGEEAQPVIERFYREARAAADIHHPNLCAVYDVDQIEGIHYLTMPFIEGIPLSRQVGSGQQWEPGAAADLIVKLAQGLGVLHERGVIHRDLKPANVLLRPGNDPVLMDFGLARSFSDLEHRLTSTGQALGTPAYMSPEQIAGESSTLGPGTDIYALGVILYQLVTGTLPFTGSLAEVYGRILHADPPPPSQHRPDLPPGLDVICLKALAKRASKRYASTAEFIQALQADLKRGWETSPSLTQPLTDVRVICPQCRRALKLPASLRGKKVKCPACKASLDQPVPTNTPITEDTLPREVVEVEPLPSPSAARDLETMALPSPITPTNSKAVASLALGVSSLVCLCNAFTGLPAVLLGVLALRELKQQPGKQTSRGLAVAGLVTGSLGILLLPLLLVLVSSTQKRDQRAEAQNNLMKVGVALKKHHDRFGRYPPVGFSWQRPGSRLPRRNRILPRLAFASVDSGQLSWRVALLPSLGHEDLFWEFNLDEPWDSEHNKALLPRMPGEYALPGDKTPSSGMTYFRVFTGPQTLFPPGERLRRDDIQDITGQTITIVEAADPVPWTKPDELEYDPAAPLPALGGHYGDSFLALFADERVRWLPANINPDTLRALITPRGGEKLERPFP
jgi:serine/threonine protein kinase